MTITTVEQIEKEKRFEFGKNWSNFLKNLDDIKIKHAVSDLKEKLGKESLKNLSFLDIGCGSGLHSISAAMLEISRLHSFDFDQYGVIFSLHDTVKSSWIGRCVAVTQANKALPNMDLRSNLLLKRYWNSAKLPSSNPISNCCFAYARPFS